MPNQCYHLYYQSGHTVGSPNSVLCVAHLTGLLEYPYCVCLPGKMGHFYSTTAWVAPKVTNYHQRNYRKAMLSCPGRAKAKVNTNILKHLQKTIAYINKRSWFVVFYFIISSSDLGIRIMLFSENKLEYSTSIFWNNLYRISISLKMFHKSYQ